MDEKLRKAVVELVDHVHTRLPGFTKELVSERLAEYLATEENKENMNLVVKYNRMSAKAGDNVDLVMKGLNEDEL